MRCAAGQASAVRAREAGSCAILLVAACLCACSNTNVVGHFELVREPVRLPLAADANVGSIGLIDGWVLVTVLRPVPGAGADWGPDATDVTAQWVSPEDALDAEVYLGRSPAERVQPRWVRVGDALAGPLWFVSDPSAPPENGLGRISTAFIRPGDGTAACNTRAALGGVVLDMLDMVHNLTYSGGGAGVGGAGWESHAPAARANESLVGFAYGTPDECRGLTAWRLLALEGRPDCTVTGTWVPTSDLCRTAAPSDDVGTLSAVSLPLGDIGVFYRPTFDNLDTRLRWLRLTDGASPRAPAVSVSGVPRIIGFDAGGAAAAAAIGLTTVAFTEREAETAECHVLRVMDLDGSAARDAPWQPGCLERRAGPLGPWWARIQAAPELLPIEAAEPPVAAFLFSDLPQHRLDDPDQAPARVAVVAIDEEGRRASEVVSLGGPGSSLSYYYRSASDGDEVAVVYLDTAVPTAGWWLARLRWVPD